MSFNVNTRLNNLQQQINTISNKGLTNPLTGPFDAAGYALNNINIINGGTKALELKTDNVGGIILDNPLYSTEDITTTSDITVDTLHYKALDPPINYNSISYTLIGSQTVQPTEGNINMFNDNPNSGFISQQALNLPSLSCSIIMVSPSGSNSIKIGFSSSSTATTPDYGVYWYPQDGNIQSIGSTGAIPYTLTTLNLDLIVVGNKLKYYVNSVEQPTLEITIPNVSYYVNCYAYVGTEIQVQNIGFVINHAQTLEDVLATGNDGGGLNITGVGSLSCNTLNYTTLNPPIPAATIPTISQVLTAGALATNQDLSGINNLSCTTLKYTTLNPPIPTAPTPTIAQVLTAGSIGTNQDLSGINNLTCTTLKYTSLSPPIPASTIPTLTQVLTAGAGAGNLSITGVNNITSVQSNSGYIVNTNSITTNQLFTNTAIYPYGTSGSNFQMWATGDALVIQQYKGTPTPVLTNQPIIITDSSSIVLNTGILALQNSYVLDSKFNTPSYKRLINNQQFNISSFLNLWGSFFSTPLYPKTVNPAYVNGLNYAELSMSNVEVLLSTKITLSTSDFFNVFLSTSQTNAFDPTQGNCITQAATQGASKIVFISSATSILYFYSQTPITNLYLNIRITSTTIQPLNIVYAYAKLSGMLSGSVCSDAAVLTFE